MNKILVSVVVVLLVFCSCGLVPEADTYKDRLDEIQSAEIVKLEKYDAESYEFAAELLSKVEKNDDFLKELSDIDCGRNWGDPQELSAGSVVIKLSYANGDYDLIGHTAQVKNRSDKNHYGFMVFDKDQFESLVDKYAGK